MVAAQEVSGETVSPRRLLVDALAFVGGLAVEFAVDSPKAMFMAGAVALAGAGDAIWHVHQNVPATPVEKPHHS